MPPPFLIYRFLKPIENYRDSYRDYYKASHKHKVPKSAHPIRKNRYLAYCNSIFFLGLSIPSILFLACWWVIPAFMSLPEQKDQTQASSLIIFDRDGESIYHQTRGDHVRHQAVTIDDIPETLMHATLAAEDKRFWEHGGVDMIATVRAAKDAVEARRFVGGASTLSQQTIKLMSGRRSRTIKVKIEETLLARTLEMEMNKEDIILTYLNLLDYGNRSQGPKQAAIHYFNKPLNQLSLAEFALIAGLPQAPTRHNPRQNPEGAIKRRNWVLDRMQIVFDYPEEDIILAKEEPLNLWAHKSDSAGRSIRNFIYKLVSNQGSSSELHTTLSLPTQREVARICEQELDTLKHQNVQNASVVIIDNETSEVICLLGNSSSSVSGQINAALTRRSPGSALKPFTYLLAFEHLGYTPATILADIPTFYKGDRGADTFVNYNRTFNGPTSLSRSLAQSLNLPAVRTLNKLGGPEPLKDFLEALGVTTLDRNVYDYGLALTIGSGDVTLMELSNAYATIARGGVYQPVSLIQNTSQPRPIRVVSEENCMMIAEILADNQARSSSFGTHSHLRLPFKCAVKTGTSTDYHDNFCVGFTKKFTVGVWVGNLDFTPMDEVSGVSGAGPIFHRVMQHLHEETSPQWFENQSLSEFTIDPHTGTSLTPDHPRYTKHESVKLVSPPAESTPSLYSPAGLPVLDRIYKDWITDHAPNKTNWALSEDLNIYEKKLTILQPSHDATYLLDPDLPNQGRLLKLKSKPNSSVIWTSKSLNIHENTATLTPGEHTITASLGTHNKQVTIYVESL